MDISKYSDIAPRFHGQFPFYEVWYGKLNFEPDRAFWFRYTLLNGKTKEAALWAIFFKGNETCFRKEIFPLETFAKTPKISIPKGYLTDTSVQGDLEDIQWNLQFKNKNGSFDHVPTLFKKLKLSKSLVCTPYLDLSITGNIYISGQRYSFQNAPGMLGHIWGKKQALGWTWSHCNAFENQKDVLFEGLSAQIPILGHPSPTLTSIYFQVGNEKLCLNRCIDLFRTTSHYKRGSWKFKAKNKDFILEGDIQSDPQKIIEIPYTDTDDTTLICHNSKLANLSLTLTELKTNQKRCFVSKNKAALEWVTR